MIHLAYVFQALTEAHLKVKTEKCCFVAHKVEFIGREISANGIEPNIINIKAVFKFATPKKVKRYTNFYWTLQLLQETYQGFVKDC